MAFQTALTGKLTVSKVSAIADKMVSTSDDYRKQYFYEKIKKLKLLIEHSHVQQLSEN